MSDLPKKASKVAAHEIASQLFWSTWPYWGAPAVTAALAYVGGYSPAIIFLMALGAFAMIALGLNNYWQWREQQSAAGKADFLIPIVGVKENNAEGAPPVGGFKLGVALRSTAPFPVEIRIDELETQIEDRVPTEAFYVRSVTVTRGITAQFTNALIDLSNHDLAGKVLHGHISARASYGKPGRVRYEIERTWYMAFRFDKAGKLEGAEPSLTEFKAKDQ